MYRVSAPFSFVPVDRQLVDAPFAGTIAEVFKDVGDTVQAGEEIARLDTRELELEASSKRKEATGARMEADSFRGRRSEDPTASAQARAKEAQAESLDEQVRLIETKIERASIKAPMNGVILQVPGGTDLKERRGTTVNQGDQLVLVGEPGNLRVQIAVADRDIQNVHVGQEGTLATAARPNVKVPIKVESIVEAAEATEGTNAFTVYATVENPDQNWRPSATGEVRLDVEPKPLIWQWTHRLVDWVRLKLWI